MRCITQRNAPVRDQAELGDAWHLSRVPRTQLFLATKLSDERSCKRKKAKVRGLTLKGFEGTFLSCSSSSSSSSSSFSSSSSSSCWRCGGAAGVGGVGEDKEK